MGRFSYFSPFLLGVIGVLILHGPISESWPAMAAGLRWTLIGLAALGVGLACQTLMVGAQGAFAQVLPVPGGRSIRGRGAVVGGVLIIAAVGLCAVAGLLRSEGVSTGAIVVGAAGVLCGIGAVIAYAWGWPTAVRDFADDA